MWDSIRKITHPSPAFGSSPPAPSDIPAWAMARFNQDKDAADAAPIAPAAAPPSQSASFHPQQPVQAAEEASVPPGGVPMSIMDRFERDKATARAGAPSKDTARARLLAKWTGEYESGLQLKMQEQRLSLGAGQRAGLEQQRKQAVGAPQQQLQGGSEVDAAAIQAKIGELKKLLETVQEEVKGTQRASSR